MSLKLSSLAKVEKSIDVRENDKDVREIDIHLAEALCECKLLYIYLRLSVIVYI